MERKYVIIEKVLFAVLLTLISSLMIKHLYSPLSVALSLKKPASLIVSCPDGKMLVYYPSSRFVSILSFSGSDSPPKSTALTANKRARPNICPAREIKRMEKYALANFRVANAPFFHISLKSAETNTLSQFAFSKTGSRLLRLMKLAAKVKSRQRTDLSWHDFFLIFKEFIGCSPSKLVFLSLTGKTAADRLNFYLLHQNLANCLREEGAFPVRTEVFNGSGKKGAAYKVTKFLRSKGIDVVNYGNYPSIQNKTKIVNYAKNLKAAFKIREAIMMKEAPVYFDYLSSSSLAESAVILGKDFIPERLPKTNY